MVLKTKSWHACDLCGKEMKHFSEDGGDAIKNQYQAMDEYEWQLWPVEDGYSEICGHCFTLLYRAWLMGLVELKGLDVPEEHEEE